MKKILFVIFIISTFFSYGQKIPDNKKHAFLFTFGMSHTSNWKDKHIPPDTRYWYTNQVTPLPPYTLSPSFEYFTDLTYRFNFKNKFYLDISLKYSLFPKVRNYNADSLKKYHIYPDSFNIELPVKKKDYENYFDFGPSFGYSYKRFSASLGLYYAIFSFYKTNFFYLHGENKKRYYGFVYFDTFYPVLKLDYLVYKKHPVYFCFEMSNSLIFGIKIQLK